MKRAVSLIVLCLATTGCSYLGTLVSQAGYSLRQMASPEQRVYKHMLERDTVFVFGRVEDVPAGDGEMAVVALSDKFRVAEAVDVNHGIRPGSHYGLNLPPGDYRLAVVRDRNHDGAYEESEVIGGRAITLNGETAPDKVLGGLDIDVGKQRIAAGGAFRIAVEAPAGRAESLIYPAGSLRSLDDPVFSPRMAELGMYEPAAFLEQAPMMFYALEEDAGYKMPVIFVHGIGGSPRDFREMVAALDRTRFKPWFFYYPSGVDLNQSGAMFYRLFLSGKTIPLGDTPVIVVAHSMGGLVVREAFNHYRGAPGEARVARLITIASPMGGHPAAQSAAKAPVVLPSWRDLDPASAFIAQLHRQPLPRGVEYHLLFAYGNDSTIKLGANSDGVVPLSSQLSEGAQKEATAQHGYDDTHTGVLANQKVIGEVTALVTQVKSPLPPAMLASLREGGYAVELGPDYTPMEGYYIRNIGRFMAALTRGEVQPVYPEQEHFVQAARGQTAPRGDVETGWVRFLRDCPARRLLAQCPGGT